MGGAERIAINIAKSKSGVEYHLVEVIRANSPFTADFIRELEDNGINYHRSTIDSNKKAILFFPFWFKNLLRELQPDVIQTHTEAPDLALFLTSLLFPSYLEGVKIVRTLHNTLLWDKWKIIGKQVESYMRKQKANVSNSMMISDVFQQEFGKDKNLKLIYNGFTPVPQETYEHLVEGKKNVLFAGRFVPQKGIPALIAAIARANKDIFHFHIAGKGPLNVELLAGVKGYDNVCVTGPIFGLAKYLGSFDYVIIPSVHEGLNSLSIEASMNNTPVIINDIDGLNETVPCDYPLKVKNNSADEYAKIFKMLETADANDFSKISNAYANEYFSMQKMQSEYEKLYHE